MRNLKLDMPLAKAMALSFVAGAFALGSGAQAQSNICPTNSVFLALGDEVRGYAARSNGVTAPCQLIQGASTTLMTADSLSISPHGWLHVIQFLTNGLVGVFPGNATGNVAPSRTEDSQTNDLSVVTTDSRVNDFIYTGRDQTNQVIVIPDEGVVPNSSFLDPDLNIESLGIDGHDNLVIVGHDVNGNAAVDTYGTSLSISAPARMTRIQGALTGLLGGSPMSVAVDASTQEVYVYNASIDGSQVQVSVFAPGANGNVAPTRVIAGPATGLGVPGFNGNKIAVSSDGRLFDSEPGLKILVFAPGSNGDVAPSQVITDPASASFSDQGGIAVRSCKCS